MSKSHPPETLMLGVQAFSSLKAEQEEDWLEQAYVEPSIFIQMSAMRSSVAFGEPGSGKTTLTAALKRRAALLDPQVLVIHWQPSIPETPGLSDAEVSQLFIRQVMDACAEALLHYSARHIEQFQALHPWVQETLAWFIRKYLATDWDFFLSRLEGAVSAEAIALLQRIRTIPIRQILPPGVPNPRLVKEFVEAIDYLNLAGVWILVDEFEPWQTIDTRSLVAFLKQLLATLGLFEDKGFSLKLILPDSLKIGLRASADLINRRFTPLSLAMDREELLKLTERRVGLALGQDRAGLEAICNPGRTDSPLFRSPGEKKTGKRYAVREAHLADWLEKCGGSSPRGWLEACRPIIEAYLENQRQQAFELWEWIEICRSNPPQLRIDAETGKVFLGYGLVEPISLTSYKLLKYAYDQPNRQCTREALYYLGMLGLEKIPRSARDPGFEDWKSWEGNIDTSLHRLRAAIELDPENPIYVVSEIGKGIVRLENTW
jgi:hypothetical protein